MDDLSSQHTAQQALPIFDCYRAHSLFCQVLLTLGRFPAKIKLDRLV
jgi:hypothetical protein